MRHIPAFLACVAFVAVWWLAFTPRPAAPIAQCTTDAECAMTPDCLADPTCDGGPY